MSKKQHPLVQLAIAGLDFKHVKVNLLGHDGNAMAIVATVSKALRRQGGASHEICKVFVAEALSDDYDHVLATVFRWVDVTAECACSGHDHDGDHFDGQGGYGDRA